MVLNDWADRKRDAVERPERPIPSGDVSPAAALSAATILAAAGVAAAAAAGGRRACPPRAASRCVWWPTTWLPRTPRPGPW
ncbi:ubiA prenyltransferase family protein [Mycobacterium ulcerans str. Harvey]|uniref:UbiA prenyltransferase family protein n=1 Tax=Mycobacterium ulcerans str. Harvey TaxID=1299332 RepID=A0ABN0R264_MYCUL|nr:ubiA prenyltransferase family protein [Mycobacterium ulcerans str. Harvey]